MLSRLDFVMMTIMTALLAVGVPLALIFIDTHIIAKIIWTLLALRAVILWFQALVSYRSGRKQNKKTIKTTPKEAFLFAGIYAAVSIVTGILVSHLDVENDSMRIFAFCITFLSFALPIALWYLNHRVRKENDNHNED